MNGPFTIEQASDGDRLAVLRVLDAAMLETDAKGVTERIGAGDVFVARFERTGAVVGALVATRPDTNRGRGESLHVDAVAVRPARRDRGIGSALVGTALDRGRADPEVDRVTAGFDESLVDFYVSLGFDVERNRISEGSTWTGDDRMRGVFPVGDGVESELSATDD